MLPLLLPLLQLLGSSGGAATAGGAAPAVGMPGPASAVAKLSPQSEASSSSPAPTMGGMAGENANALSGMQAGLKQASEGSKGLPKGMMPGVGSPTGSFGGGDMAGGIGGGGVSGLKF
jgi:hypothetical protein